MRVSLLLAILALFLAVGAGAYFYSDVFSTRIDKAVEQFAEWTPENIAKDPVGYLHFCKTETLKTIESLKASEIGTTQNRAKIHSIKEGAQNKVAVGKQALSELKTLYRAAKQENKWPITWKSMPRDEDWTKRQILGLHKQVTQEEAFITKADQGLQRCDTELSTIRELRTQGSTQLSEIEVSERSIRVQQLSSELKDRLVGMKSALTTIAQSADTLGDDITLEALSKESASAFDEKQFEAIMKAEN